MSASSGSCTAASPPGSGAAQQGSDKSERGVPMLATAYLGEEERAEEAGEEEEGAG
jgi:hypothetical protein